MKLYDCFTEVLGPDWPYYIHLVRYAKDPDEAIRVNKKVVEGMGHTVLKTKVYLQVAGHFSEGGLI